MSRLDAHARTCTSADCPACESLAESRANPAPASDLDAYVHGLREENSAAYWMEAGR